MGDEQGEGLADPAGQVLVGPDADEAVDVEGVGDVDVGDPRVRVRAADEGGREGVAPEVVEVATTAGDEARVLLAPDGGTEHLGRHGCSALISAARSTDFTMFW